MTLKLGDRNETVRRWRQVMNAMFGGTPQHPGLYARLHGPLPTDTDVFGQRAVEEDPSGLPPELRIPSRFRGSRVLLAEDNELNQLVAKELLESSGFMVDIADSGQVALSMAEQEDYAMVFMDIHMPEMDGIEAAKRLRADARYALTPIIALTADSMVGDKEKSLAAGMNDHLPKPIDPYRLVDVATQWLLWREKQMALLEANMQSMPD